MLADSNFARQLSILVMQVLPLRLCEFEFNVSTGGPILLPYRRLFLI
jgi:hypothetical protein